LPVDFEMILSPQAREQAVKAKRRQETGAVKTFRDDPKFHQFQKSSLPQTINTVMMHSSEDEYLSKRSLHDSDIESIDISEEERKNDLLRIIKKKSIRKKSK